MRREMLLKRLDVLADSFSWSERAKEQRGEMEAALAARRASLPPPSTIEPRDAFGATADLLELQRAAALSEGASVKKVRIGKVPDRGGRADGPFSAANRFRSRRRASAAAVAAAAAAVADAVAAAGSKAAAASREIALAN